MRGGEGEMKDAVTLMLDSAQVKGVMGLAMVTLWREGIGSARAIREDGIFEVRVVAKHKGRGVG